MRRVIHAAAIALLAVACGRRSPPQPLGSGGPASSATSAASAASVTPSPAPPTSAGHDLHLALRGTPCGPLDCAQYGSPREAFADVLRLDPLVLGIGEAHAPKGATAPSAARRFTGELLPLLAGRASDLIVELMMPPRGCVDAAAEVRHEQQPVTSRQAPTDQGEYVSMGESARALGIVPDMLRPSCADLDAVRTSGDDAIGASLSLIARLSDAQAERLVDRDARSDADRGKIVVLYGGMLHDDLRPSPGRADWSYAPRLDAHVGGRLVALDLVVPEYIGDDATWRALPWWSSYDRARLGGKTTLFRVGERSFVLVFPAARPSTRP